MAISATKLVINDVSRASEVQKDVVPLIDPNTFRTIRIAVSYVRLSGVDCLSAKLAHFVKNGGQVKLLFGDDFRISESTALRELLRIGVNLRLFVGKQGINYHPKMWIFEGTNRLASLTGSSNLSRPALSTNIEANVLIEDNSSMVRRQIEYFDTLWDKFSFKQIDDEWIDHYTDMERALSAETTYGRNGLVDHKSSVTQISNFIDDWMRHISTPRKRGQYERWRGWYFIPEPAGIDESKMLEFKHILQNIGSSTEYQHKGYASLTTSYVNEILKKSRIKYKGHGQMTKSPEGRRDLFIRQHKDYLERLGFIRAVDKIGSKISITSIGKRLAKSTSPQQRKRMFTNALDKVSWPWAPKLKLFDFLIRLMEGLPKKRIYYHELSFLVIHAEHGSMFRPIHNLVLMFRGLPKAMKKSLISKYEKMLESELTKRKNKWAYYRYCRKIHDLISLLSYASGTSCHQNQKNEDSYIELTGGRKA